MQREFSACNEAFERDLMDAIERTRASLNELYVSCQGINQDIIRLSQKLDDLIVQATAVKMQKQSTVPPMQKKA